MYFFISQKKRSAHERAWENVTSGEWASGKKWADDAPREAIDADQINLMSSGACGAFVHGLEDEFLGKIFFYLCLKIGKLIKNYSEQMILLCE